MITIRKVRLKVLEIDKSETTVLDQKNDEINTSKIESMCTLGRCQICTSLFSEVSKRLC